MRIQCISHMLNECIAITYDVVHRVESMHKYATSSCILLYVSTSIEFKSLILLIDCLFRAYLNNYAIMHEIGHIGRIAMHGSFGLNVRFGKSVRFVTPKTSDRALARPQV